MSMLAACGHKAEWICRVCARCPTCCECVVESEPVHINTKLAAFALYRYARDARKKKSAGPGDPSARGAFDGGNPPRSDNQY